MNKPENDLEPIPALQESPLVQVRITDHRNRPIRMNKKGFYVRSGGKLKVVVSCSNASQEAPVDISCTFSDRFHLISDNKVTRVTEPRQTVQLIMEAQNKLFFRVLPIPRKGNIYCNVHRGNASILLEHPVIIYPNRLLLLLIIPVFIGYIAWHRFDNYVETMQPLQAFGELLANKDFWIESLLISGIGGALILLVTEFFSFVGFGLNDNS